MEGLNLALPGAPERHLILLHGIFSDPATWEPLIDRLRQKSNLPYTVWSYGYEWRDPIQANGDYLASAIDEKRRHGAMVGEVTIAGHSMGGLVGLFCAMLMPKQIARLILLGTPTQGAITPGAMGIVASVSAHAANGLIPLFLRAPGLMDLTRVDALLRPKRSELAQALERIQVITIPGMLFRKDSSQSEKWEGGWFYVADLCRQILEETIPMFSFELDLPHDGVVEESAVKVPPWAYKMEGTTCIPPCHIHVVDGAYYWAHTDIHRAHQITDIIHDMLEVGDFSAWRGLLKGDPFRYSGSGILLPE